MSNTEEIKEQAKFARTLLNDSIIKEINEKNQRLATGLPQALDSLKNMSISEASGNVHTILDLLAETIDARVERDQLDNMTIQGLAVAEDVDKIFKEYSSAFNQNATAMDMNTSHVSMNMSRDLGNDTTIEIPMDIGAYNRVVALIDITIGRFNVELKGKSTNVSSEEDALNGLEQLRYAMHSNERPTELLGIVHGEIHPSLKRAFGLQLSMST